MLENFTNLYPVSKTLRFSLIPQGKTLETILADNSIGIDEKLEGNYKIAKDILDEYYKYIIEENLSKIHIEQLEAYSTMYYTHSINFQDKDFIKLREQIRKSIIKEFSNNIDIKELFNKNLLTKLVPQYLKEQKAPLLAEKLNILAGFDNFSTYFTGFFENRKNIFSAEDKSTALAYRIVDENLPIFLDNIASFDKIKNQLQSQLEEVEKNLKNHISMEELSFYFTLEGFNKVLSQKGIDLYQTILGGYTTESGEKIQGINEKINLYNQKCSNKASKLPKLKSLKKQILSDRTSFSFILNLLEKDEELLKVLMDFQSYIFDQEYPLLDALEHLNNYLKNSQGKGIIINQDTVKELSNFATKDWSCTSRALEEEYDKRKNTLGNEHNEKYLTNRQKELDKVENYDLAKLNDLTLNYIKEHNIDLQEKYLSMELYFVDIFTTALKELPTLNEKINKFLATPIGEIGNIRHNDEIVKLIKDYLDLYMSILHGLKPMANAKSNISKDEVFYNLFLPLWDRIQIIISIYNKVRNYITKKPYSTEKIKLNFNCATLLNGWDLNKETDNRSVLLLQGKKYYLAIMKQNKKKVFIDAPYAKDNENYYKKMDYKLLPGPNKMLPKVFFSKKNEQLFTPSEEILKLYKNGSFKKGDNFSLADCHALIDFYKTSIYKHPDWKNFNFNFKPTKDYEDISQFYSHVAEQGYKITFRNIPADYIDQLVETGNLLLFEIYNKDFSPNSKGKPNLHTLYWKALFNEENLANVIYKLNGDAEIFYRKASLPLVITHPANQPIHRKNPKLANAQSIFPYDLIKDKRYVYDKFLLHIPITINFKSKNKTNINDLTRKAIKNNKEQYIIGIDRGERHLLYVVVINSKGKIVEQRSLNIINHHDGRNNISTDYHHLLSLKEKENMASKKNWRTTNTIKEIKDGYLSLAIKEITNLIEKYEAIVILEDLNIGFKNSRCKVEKQVYQRFEKMLIDKLNLLVNKDRTSSELGSVLKPYQLTSQFDSFKKMGKQTGILFYVPAWNTSKIDPSTGFVNLLKTKYENISKAKEFINSFEDIFWAKNPQGVYELFFKLRYSKTKHNGYGLDQEWLLSTYGTRIYNKRTNTAQLWQSEEIDLTTELINFLNNYGITAKDGSIKTQLLTMEQAEFFKTFMYYCSLMLQIRNSQINTEIDYMISPVVRKDGKHFDTRNLVKGMPANADANGAYNIAKKGLFIVDTIKNTKEDALDKLKLLITNQDWLEYAQSNPLK